MNDFLTDLYGSHFESQARQNEFKGKSGTEERMVVRMLERNRNAAPAVQQSNQPYQYPSASNNNAFDRAANRAAATRAKNRDWGQKKKAAPPKKKGITLFRVLLCVLVGLPALLVLYIKLI